MPEQNKRLTLPLVRENSPCLLGLQSGASALPCSTAAATLQTQATSLTLQSLDLPASIYHLSVCLSTYLPTYIATYLSCWCLFPWRALTNTSYYRISQNSQQFCLVKSAQQLPGSKVKCLKRESKPARSHIILRPDLGSHSSFLLPSSLISSESLR